jgi:hypothetical protein
MLPSTPGMLATLKRYCTYTVMMLTGKILNILRPSVIVKYLSAIHLFCFTRAMLYLSLIVGRHMFTELFDLPP